MNTNNNKKEKLTCITRNAYWNIDSKLFSHTEANIFIATGPRGVGKTFNCLKKFISEYIKYGYQFAYIRRYEKDIGSPNKLVNDPALSDYFPDYTFSAGGGEFRMKRPNSDKWEVFGAYKVLNDTGNAKGTVILTNCLTVWMDEFQIDIKDKRLTKYIDGEFDLFVGMFESFTRGRKSQDKDPKMVLTSNARSINNPYFTALKLKVDPTKEIIKNTIKQPGCRDLIVVLEQVENKEFMRQKKLTVSGALMSLCSDSDSTLNNEYIEDNYSFIKKRDRRIPAKAICNLYLKGKLYGVWENNKGIFIDIVTNDNVNTYSPYLNDKAEGISYIRSGKTIYELYYMMVAYEEEMLFFNTLESKYDVEEALHKWNMI